MRKIVGCFGVIVVDGVEKGAKWRDSKKLVVNTNILEEG